MVVLYCFISGIVGAMLMMFALGIVSLCKDKEPRNKVHFYVTKGGCITALWIGRPSFFAGDYESNMYSKFLAYKSNFRYFGLNPVEYEDMKEGEIREVFLNLED